MLGHHPSRGKMAKSQFAVPGIADGALKTV